MKFINIGCYELYDKSVERELWRERERGAGREGRRSERKERERERERGKKREVGRCVFAFAGFVRCILSTVSIERKIPAPRNA